MGSPLSREIKNLLRCPETQQALRFVGAADLAAMQQDFPEGGWITEDRTRVYPVRDGFPILLVTDSVKLSLADAD